MNFSFSLENSTQASKSWKLLTSNCFSARHTCSRP